MQWDRSQNAGFSTAAKPWLPVPPSAAQHNVDSEKKEADSIFNFYKRVIALRRELPVLQDGSYVTVNRDDQNVLAYLRKSTHSADAVVVALNMSAQPRTISFKLKGFGVDGNSLQVILASPAQGSSELSLDGIKLGPFGVLIASVR
jgi:alpha-glucosidase